MALIQIQAYTNTADNNVVDKTPYLTQIGTAFTVKPTEQLDVENPVFIVNYNASLLGCNYIYASEYGRYYYANVVTKPGNEAIIECVSDPLMSFKTAILNCDILVLRSESVGGPTMYEDTKLPVYPTQKNVTSIVMNETSGLFDANGTECYVLTVISGTPST